MNELHEHEGTAIDNQLADEDLALVVGGSEGPGNPTDGTGAR